MKNAACLCWKAGPNCLSQFLAAARRSKQRPSLNIVFACRAAIWLLQLTDADSPLETYNELRRKLNLPELGDLDTADLDVNRLPLDRICRLNPTSLTNEQLQLVFNRAVVANFALALRRLAPEVIKRPLPAVEYKLSAYRWLVRSAANAAESLRLIDEARKLAEANKQVVCCLGFNGTLAAHSARRSVGGHATYRSPATPTRPRAWRCSSIGTIADANRFDWPRWSLGNGRRAISRCSQELRITANGFRATPEPGKLWTPDAPESTGEKKSSLWLPE